MPKKSPKQLFQKLFYRYTILIVCIVLALAIYFISSTRNRILETNRNYTHMTLEKACESISYNYDTVGYIQADLYQTAPVLNDLLMYLQSENEEYQRHRLNSFMASSGLTYEGFDDFFEKSMQAYQTIQSIELISYSRQEDTLCNPDGKNYRNQNAQQRVRDVERGNLARDGIYSFVKEIRDPSTLASVGCMIVNFKVQELEAIQKYYTVGELLVYSGQKTAVFQSDEKLDTKAVFTQSESGNIQQYLNSYVEESEVQSYRVCSYLPKSRAGKIPVSVLLTIIGIGAIVILLGELCIRHYLLRLTGRLNEIIDVMHQVTMGDLKVRLDADQNGDELDVISGHFNEMCQELDCYIQKSYLAEIEQKNAELEVLQNQINPHFLYNTLEVIRMKAICNGDREVGKMLYTMSVIFRSQLKDNDIIPLIQEVHYCKKYLELFEYRYQGKFSCMVDCPEELMDYPVMKFILQPIVENYFVHGIRAEQTGNQVHVWAEKTEDALILHVEDNGKGMEQSRIEEKNKELRENSAGDRRSVGITNVNRRIRAVYGEGYGVFLSESSMGGLHVTVKIGSSDCVSDKIKK